MLKELKTLFAQQAEQELLQTTQDFHSCKKEEGQSVSSYVLKMKGYIDNLERLGHPMTLGLAHAYAPNPKIPPPPKREDPAKDSICHECGETGHWKRNCPQYLAELLKKKKNAASGAGGGSEEIYSQRKAREKQDHLAYWPLPEDHLVSSIRKDGCKSEMWDVPSKSTFGIMDDFDTIEEYDLEKWTYSYTEYISCSNKCKESYANLKKLYDAQREQLSDASIEIKAYSQEGMHDVPPPMTGNYMPQDLNVVKCQPKVGYDAPTIEEYESDSEDE
ncbi:zinc finger, CCHC-type containing protein, partial [Tanacetum coccineum]